MNSRFQCAEGAIKGKQFDDERQLQSHSSARIGLPLRVIANRIRHGVFSSCRAISERWLAYC